MNYVTTNIRISEEDYLKLKTEAAQKRKSLSAIIREKLQREYQTNTTEEVKKQMKDLDNLVSRDSQYFKGVDGVSVIHEMRYEDA